MLIIPFTLVLLFGIILRQKHRRTLELIFSHPACGSVRWSDVEGMFKAMGADVQERRGSRVSVLLFDEIRVFHRPHPSPDMDKRAVADVRNWLLRHGVKP